jgi:membrane-associated phospholipid phosphatase
LPKKLASCLALAVTIWLPAAPSRAQAPEPPAAAAEPRPRPEVETRHLGFFSQLGQDYVRFVSPGNLAILGAGGVAALGAHPYDRRWTDDFRGSPKLDGFFEIGDAAGGGLVQGGAALGTYVVGRLAHSPKIADLGGDLIRAQIISGTATWGVKVATGRDRPDGTRWSFPSGHTSASFATATVLERHFGWKVGVPAYALATYVGASRLQENKHFASDVLFGAAVGIAAGRAVTFDHGRKRVTLSPLVVPGGVGIALVGVGR